MTKIADIEGIGDVYATKLGAAGVTTVEALLEKGASRKGREDLAKATSIEGRLILKWVNHADLFRINGVAGQYAELLEAAGVDTVAELAQRNAANLHKMLEDANTKKKLVRALPAPANVEAWVTEAKKLKRVVEY